MTNTEHVVNEMIERHSAIDDFFDVDDHLISEVTEYLYARGIEYELLHCGNIYSLVFVNENDEVCHYMFREGYIEEGRRNV